MRRNLWAAYFVVTVLGTATVLALWIMGMSALDRVKQWWERKVNGKKEINDDERTG